VTVAQRCEYVHTVRQATPFSARAIHRAFSTSPSVARRTTRRAGSTATTLQAPRRAHLGDRNEAQLGVVEPAATGHTGLPWNQRGADHVSDCATGPSTASEAAAQRTSRATRHGGHGMEDVRVVLSGLWVALMLTYLLGDVLRVFAGDFTPGEIQGQRAAPWMWLLAAAVMLIPIVMLVLSLVLPYPAIRWTSIAASVFLVLFNLVGLPYPGAYDNALIVVGLIFNALIVWYAWTWP
jgi:hypothetical protein